MEKSQVVDIDKQIKEKLRPEIIDVLLSENIKDLYPPQKLAVLPAISNKNIVVSIPTASGKTLIAEISIIQKLLENRRKGITQKALYLCPLKALASEKYYEFKKRWAKLGFKVGFAVGDVDNYDYRVFENDIIILTNEKADSLLRSKPQWIKEIGILVVDEIHLLNDNSRGIILEILLTRITEVNPEVQIIGLSATISNADEIAGWLHAELITSDWRPIQLKEGYYKDNCIVYSDEDIKTIKYQTKDPIYNLIMDVLDDGGQCLVFVNSRNNSRSLAEKLYPKLGPRLSEKEVFELRSLSEEFEGLVPAGDLTRDAQILTKTLKCGVAFHNAGLSQEQRRFIEDNFRKGKIKVLTATPTLAAGVNTPARRVIIQSIYRYESDVGGMQKIPVMEYKQMSGRAGRPGYDPYGDSILISSNEARIQELADYYIKGAPEWIVSKLNSAELLQTHILGNIVMNQTCTEDSLINFFLRTFLAYQIDKYKKIKDSEKTDNPKLAIKNSKINDSKPIKLKRKSSRGEDPLKLLDMDLTFHSAADMVDNKQKIRERQIDALKELNLTSSSSDIKKEIKKIISEAIDFLNTYEFITKQKQPNSSLYYYSPTKLGNITTQLYLNPYIAQGIIRRVNLVKKILDSKSSKYKIDEITFLYIMALTGEFQGINFKQSDYDVVTGLIRNHENKINMFTFDVDPEENTSIYQDMNALKQTLILMEWINENPESDITERYEIGTGDLQRMNDTAQWLARAIVQYSKFAKSDYINKIVESLNIRIKYGIRKELIQLIRLKGIGRVRARILYKNGFFTLQDISNAPDTALERLPLFSKSLIKSIREQLASGKLKWIGTTQNLETSEEDTETELEIETTRELIKDSNVSNSKKKKSSKSSGNRQTTLF